MEIHPFMDIGVVSIFGLLSTVLFYAKFYKIIALIEWQHNFNLPPMYRDG